MFFAWLSDSYCQRALFIAIQAVLTLIGLLLTAYSPTATWRYIGAHDPKNPIGQQLTPAFLRHIFKQCGLRRVHSRYSCLCERILISRVAWSQLIVFRPAAVIE